MVVLLGYPVILMLFTEVHPAKDASPTLNYCSAAQELMCQGFGVNIKWQTLRLQIFAVSTALRYSCLEQKLN